MLIVQTIGIITKGNVKVRYCKECFNVYFIYVSIVFQYVFVVIQLPVSQGESLYFFKIQNQIN